ncbi:MAG: hypothetical protein COT81_05215 [Candidatus Buchananbacteria bacterium CG10_big_fil_rev_8_21_14_0_10_42_9]|uniref:Multidrug resistance protein MdtA-like C-terminal permuted SH3 domain-containing protein n=1 Tax=Candidatus Buchananbacteria bacterium CG10_big_fil_rev_8_21_14_0_10_42_9 TaxID=1974526 RepID=A0A2H0W245_9BACT|nr:MAG: hypothetical protein COT81_05215 [Candidatus Buchananbacteria bacterium CG10_big_fil_rev_8_21_14_0_10_42_9]
MVKKVSLYLTLFVIAGVALTGFWAYQRYFKQNTTPPLEFTVEQGDLSEVIRVRGEVAFEQEFNLEFPFSGIVGSVNVVEGQHVKANDELMRLETTNEELEVSRLLALRSQYQATLNRLINGPTAQEIKVKQTAVLNSQKALDDKELNLTHVKNEAEVDLQNLYDAIPGILADAYTKADDAVNKQIDALFSNDNTSNPTLTFTTGSQIKNDAELRRQEVTGTLAQFNTLVSILPSDDLGRTQAMVAAKGYLSGIKLLLDRLTEALNQATGVDATTLGTYKANVNTGRTNINTVIDNINNQEQSIAAQKASNTKAIATAQAAVNDAENALLVAQNELDLLIAEPRPEDIEIERAKISQTDSQIGAAREKIRQAILRAPSDASVLEVNFKAGELFQPGKVAVVLSGAGLQVEADVSELDIAKISANDPVSIELDALPGQLFDGEVSTIEAKEIEKDSDIFYRLNIVFKSDDETQSQIVSTSVRSGMSADLFVMTEQKTNVVIIPEFTVTTRDGGEYVTILEGGKFQDIKIETGITDGDNIEVISGLTAGQTVVVTAE